MKKKIIGGIIAAILATAVLISVVWYRNNTQINDDLKIKAGTGEEIVYVTIDQIIGNDIEVSVLDEETAEQMIALSKAAKSVQNETTGNFGNTDMSAAAGFMGGGMPDMGGGMPDMGGGMPEGGVPEGPMEKEEVKASYRIPVGTDVITSLGATTTFSHLEEGDTIAILKEQGSDVILKIWMIM